MLAGKVGMKKTSGRDDIGEEHSVESADRGKTRCPRPKYAARL